jgi:hypothetical protein
MSPCRRVDVGTPAIYDPLLPLPENGMLSVEAPARLWVLDIAIAFGAQPGTWRVSSDGGGKTRMDAGASCLRGTVSREKPSCRRASGAISWESLVGGEA